MTNTKIVSVVRFLIGTSLILLSSSVGFSQYAPNYLEAAGRQQLNVFSPDAVFSKLRTRPRIYEGARADSSNSAKKTEKESVSISVLEQMTFDVFNKTRAEMGLKPVSWNEELARIARTHSQNMAVNDFFSHRGLDGRMIDDRADAAGFTKWRKIGENIAFIRGYDDPATSAMSNWLKSTGHRQNLLGSKWQQSGIGIALAADGKTYYFTQVFVVK